MRVTLKDNIISNCGKAGVRIGAGVRFDMTGGSVSDCPIGVEVDGDADGRIRGVDIHNIRYEGILITESKTAELAAQLRSKLGLPSALPDQLIVQEAIKVYQTPPLGQGKSFLETETYRYTKDSLDVASAIATIISSVAVLFS